MFETLLKKQIELDTINNDIIQRQKEHIQKLDEHIVELSNLIEKYLLKLQK